MNMDNSFPNLTLKTVHHQFSSCLGYQEPCMLIPRIIFKKSDIKCIRIVSYVKLASLTVRQTFYRHDAVMNIK